MNMQRVAENYFFGLAIAIILAFLPLLNWLGFAWAVLMVLRRNIYVGFISVFVIGLLCVFILNGLRFTGSVTELISLFTLILPMWLMAYSLRSLRSLSLSLQLGCMLVFLLSVCSYLVYGPVSYDEVYLALRDRLFWDSSLGYAVTSPFQEAYLSTMTSMMILAWPATLFLMQVSLLLFARFLQSHLYNPGGFQAEFHALRLSRWTSAPLLLCFLWAGFSPENQLAVQAAALVAMLFGIAGLAWLHWYMKERQLSKRWVVGLYAILFVLSAWALPVLVVIAVLDSHLDLRKKRGMK
jgi:hypothetical protein